MFGKHGGETYLQAMNLMVRYKRGFGGKSLSTLQTRFLFKGLFRLTVLHALGINYICSTVVLLWSLYLYMYLVRRLNRCDTSDAKVTNQANKIQVSIVLSLAFVLMVFNLLVVPLPVPDGIVPGYGWWRYWAYLPGTSQFFFSMYPSLTWLGMTIYGCGLGLIMIKWKRSHSGYAKWNMVSWCLGRKCS
jgi:hypothetical protein